MSKLRHIRRALSSLRRRRAVVREASAATALSTGGAWIMSAMFVIDYLFEMDALQRTVILGVGALLAVWVFVRYALPLLGWPETTLDVALLVERKARIDSDLVAALQFEAGETGQSGSPELEEFIVDRVAAMSTGGWRRLAVSYQQFNKRFRLFLLTAIALAVVMFYFPGHVSAFFDRLLLRSTHYPTRSVIESIVVNAEPVLDRLVHQTQPAQSRWAQGMPVTFLVRCAGDVPDSGKLRIRSVDGRAERSLELQPLSMDARRARLEDAAATIEGALSTDRNVDNLWTRELRERTVFDAPRATEWLQRPSVGTRNLVRALDAVRHRLKNWPNGAAESTVFLGRMGRLSESVDFQVFAGDAWTDPGRIDMTPLPLVDVDLDVAVPEYARGGESLPSASQPLTILEGSDVLISLRSMNGKKLQTAWIVVEQDGTSETCSLQRSDAQGLEWRMNIEGTPFSGVMNDIHYEIQVTDEDGLGLEIPIRGAVRVRGDRPPHGSIDTIHRVVLGTAKPMIDYRAIDDYGIGSMRLVAQVEPKVVADLITQENNRQDIEATAPKTIEVPVEGGRLDAARLPWRDTYTLDLASLDLSVGDRLKVSLELTDYRGDAAGVSYLSEPLFLEVADEAGVLAAIAEADKESEEQLSEVIKQQLGIGETQ